MVFTEYLSGDVIGYRSVLSEAVEEGTAVAVTSLVCLTLDRASAKSELHDWVRGRVWGRVRGGEGS